MINWKKVKHFLPQEWKKDPDKVAPELVYVTDAIRGETIKYRPPKGVMMIIHVAWDFSGHSSKSYHYTGLAVDFHFKDYQEMKHFTYWEQFILLSSFRELGGIGFYPDWKHPGWHIDLRNRNPRLLWSRINGKYRYGIDAILRGIELAMIKRR